MFKKFPTKSVLALSLAVLGIAGRLFAHPWNFTPVGAITFFLAARLEARYFLPALFAILLVSDFFLGFYQWPIMVAVYGSFVLTGLTGRLLRNQKAVPLAAGVVGSSLLFFFVTNWAVWQFGSMYEHSFAGLVQSYFMALPFFRNSLAGDLLYTGLLFGSFEAVRRLFSKPSSARLSTTWLFRPIFRAHKDI